MRVALLACMAVLAASVAVTGCSTQREPASRELGGGKLGGGDIADRAPTVTGLASPVAYLSELGSELRKAWPDNRTIRIVCHGHSVPAGYFKTPVVDTFHAYPHLLHAALKKRFPHAVVNVIVTAVGGEASDQGCRRFDADVLGLRPDLITIDYGLNDRRIGLQESRRSLLAMLAAARRAHVPVLLLTPTLDSRSKPSDAEDPLRLQAELIRQVAAASGVGLVDSYQAFLSAVAGDAGDPEPLAGLLAQSNHPNHRGHQIVVAELLRWFPSVGEQEITDANAVLAPKSGR
ncbi:MAG: SGNH/GDSL hydrolase family protein [Planctomycetota bacterium]